MSLLSHSYKALVKLGQGETNSTLQRHSTRQKSHLRRNYDYTTLESCDIVDIN
jgi:hypothetical protein